MWKSGVIFTEVSSLPSESKTVLTIPSVSLKKKIYATKNLLKIASYVQLATTMVVSIPTAVFIIIVKYDVL